MAKRPSARSSATDSKEAILATAIPLFANNGCAAVSIRDIASEANVNIPTIYHHFGDKQGLYQECCSIVFAKANRSLRDSIADGDPPVAKITAFVGTLYRMLSEETDLSKLFLRELADHDEAGLAKLTEESFTTAFEALYLAVGGYTGRAPEPILVISIFALTFGLAQMSHMRPALRTDVDPTLASAGAVAQFVVTTMLGSPAQNGEAGATPSTGPSLKRL